MLETHVKMSVFIAFKGFNFYILLTITAAGVVLCGGPKMSRRASSIVLIIFYFWSFEISGNILRILKLLWCLEPCIRQYFAFLTPL